MKKFLSAILIVATLILAGCGNKYSDETFLRENASWVESKDNIADFLDAADTGDEDFFTQQFIDGKILGNYKDTEVAVTGELNDGRIIEIKFLKGQYKNKVGYTLPEFIRDVKKEQELAEAEKSRTIPFEKLSFEDKQSYDSLVGKGVYFNLSNISPNSTYGRLTGKTNLPDGTKITISAVEATVKKDMISVTLAAPPAKQLNVRILGEQFQLVNVRTINAEIIKNKGDNYDIFNKDLTVDIY